MITHIEIDGFKTFSDFAVDLAPFQVIIGANGCGKSNLFDALDLLSGLADGNLRTAFKNVRGDINELFTVLPNGESADRMRFAVEMFSSAYDYSDEAELSYYRLRYEVEIRRRTTSDGFEQLYVFSDRLASLCQEADKWSYLPANVIVEYRSCEDETIAASVLASEVESGTSHSSPQRSTETRFRFVNYPAAAPLSSELVRIVDDLTLLAGIPASSPYLRAAKNEMQYIRLLRFDTVKLRQPGKFSDEPMIAANGENLPATLARMQKLDKHLLKDVSRDVFNIVPGIAAVELEHNANRKEFDLSATTRDGRKFTIDALSEGTLRVLALATLRHDPALCGTLCIEDPEADVHPGALKRIVSMLRSMVTDFNDSDQVGEPLRQVLVTSHSPNIISGLNVGARELLYAEMVRRIEPGKAPKQVTRMTPVGADVEGDRGAKSYAVNQIYKFLNSADSTSIRSDLARIIG